jgi:hypothetical protein
LAEPSQYTESGPDSSRILSIWSPISLIASDQLIRCQAPPTSYIG